MEIGSFQPKSSELGDPKWSDNLKVMFFPDHVVYMLWGRVAGSSLQQELIKHSAGFCNQGQLRASLRQA